jgi:hypothetical protein
VPVIALLRFCTFAAKAQKRNDRHQVTKSGDDGQASEAAIALAKFGQGCVEVVLREIGPEGVDED